MKSKRDIEKREDRITYLANKKIDRIEQKRGSKLEGKEIIDVFDDAEKYVKAKDKAKRQKQKQRRKLRNKIIAILGALGITIGGGHALLTSGETQDANIKVEENNTKLPEIKNEIKAITSIELIEEKENEKVYSLKHTGSEDIRKELFKKCVDKDITIIEMKKKEISLEDAFLKITKEEEKK